MTRPEIKQAAKILLGIPRSSLNGYDRALIAADELIDKLEARVSELETDKAKLREAAEPFAKVVECNSGALIAAHLAYSGSANVGMPLYTAAPSSTSECNTLLGDGQNGGTDDAD